MEENFKEIEEKLWNFEKKISKELIKLLATITLILRKTWSNFTKSLAEGHKNLEQS